MSAAGVPEQRLQRPALHGIVPTASKCLNCKRSVEITTTDELPRVIKVRVLHPHHELCHTYANQRPFDAKLREWFIGVCCATGNFDKALDVYDHFLLRLCSIDERNMYGNATDFVKEFAIKPPPLPENYTLSSFEARMLDTRFYPKKELLKNYQASIAREWQLEKGDAPDTYAHLRRESGGLQSGDEVLLNKMKALTTERCLYYQEQHCECTNADGQGLKVCTKGAKCKPFLCILQVRGVGLFWLRVCLSVNLT